MSPFTKESGQVSNCEESRPIPGVCAPPKLELRHNAICCVTIVLLFPNHRCLTFRPRTLICLEWVASLCSH
ncbi:hypothetical protein V2G26_002124 [Clonostachys chloroleuca]